MALKKIASNCTMYLHSHSEQFSCLATAISLIALGVIGVIGFIKGKTPLNPNFGWAFVGLGSAISLCTLVGRYAIRKKDFSFSDLLDSLCHHLFLTGIAYVFLGAILAKGRVEGKNLGWSVIMYSLLALCGGVRTHFF